MTMKDKELQKAKQLEFKENFARYYPVEALKKLGFQRGLCTKCNKAYWSTKLRQVCGDPVCTAEGATFIGKGVGKKIGYKEGYDLFVKTFKKWGYKPIKRYPVVSRWYEGHNFVEAGINIFQPFVVSGQSPPPAPAVLEDQFCLRFNDIENAGLTGRHYTGFIMVGQHVFNTPEKHIYFKEEGVQQMTDFFTKTLKIPKDELVLHEDVWVGGGNFGPSIEFFSHGLEIANQVYMQYEQTPDGYRELQLKVIDMGAGAERWAWLSSGEPMSYDVVFPEVMDHLYRKTKLKKNKEVWEKFARFAAIIDVEEEDINKTLKEVANRIGVDPVELRREILPIAALYAIADHTRTLLVAIHDGELPSNVGGGYNLRIILRRCFALIDRYQFDIDLAEVIRLHMKEFGKWYKDLPDTPVIFDVLKIEKERYLETIAKARQIIEKTEAFDVDTMLKLYESNGITPDLIKQVRPDIELPSAFYSRLEELKKPALKKEEGLDLTGVPKTAFGFREDQHKMKFKSRAIKQIDNFVILDKTYFYPRMGGQDWDLGTLDGIPLKSVQIFDGVVLHELSKAKKFEEGQDVFGQVDEERRTQLTITHSAVHVVGAAAKKVLGKHINQAGTEKTIDKGRIDLTHYKPLTFEEFQKIEKIANQIVKKGIRSDVKVMPRAEAEAEYGLRIYQGGAVPGKDVRLLIIGDEVQACGGTHTENTKEIKFIKLISSERVKDGVVRIELMVGDKALEKAQENEKILKQVAQMWDISYKEVPKTAERFFNEWKDQRKRLKEVTDSMTSQLIAEKLRTSDIAKVNVPTSEFGDLVKITEEASKGMKNKAIIAIGDNFAYGISNNPDIHANKELAKICEKIEGNEKKARGFKLKK
jgi:alanyl-tRNA synthetase